MIESKVKELIAYLKSAKLKVTTAESCTGGLIASTIVSIPGASDVLDVSYVTYANSAKVGILGVKEETLETYGAVSEQTAREMAEGVLAAAGADCAIAVTGIAGPDGGTEEKPVGTVYAGFAIKNRTWVREYHFSGDRTQVREQTVAQTIEELYLNLISIQMS